MLNSKPIALITLVIALALAALGPSPAAAQSGAGGVGLWDAAHFSGTATLTRQSVPDLARFGEGWANRISGLRVIEGVAVAAYTQANYQGTCETFTSQDGWLGDNAIGNDTIRSIKVGYTCFARVPGRVIVTDVTAVTGSSTDAACPDGYTKKQQNLNEGAGGDYVYACVAFGPRTSQQVIRGIDGMSDVWLTTLRYNCSSANERLVDVDLNSGVSSSRYVMMCLNTVTKADPVYGLQDIGFVASDDSLRCVPPFNCGSHDQRIREACASRLGTGFTGSFPDLNNEASGKYIFLCTKTVDEAVPITQVQDAPPTITPLSRTPANAAGWNRSEVTVTWRCTAGDSPLTSPQIITRTARSEGANQSAAGACTDLSGHEATGRVSNINIDSTPPAVTPLSRTEPNGAGWNRGDVVVRWRCDDALSGAEDHTTSSTVQGEGTGLRAHGTCRDRAGNERIDVLGGINIDRTAPELQATATMTSRRLPYTPGTWTGHDVRVTFNCDDPLSGVLDVTGPTTLSASGADQSAHGTCTDRAGNAAEEVFTGVNIDKVAPEIVVTRSAEPNAAGWNRTDVTVEFTCADALSGLAAPCPAAVEFTNEGADQYAWARVIDHAGNKATRHVEVNIDKTAPTLTATRTAPNAHGWNNTDVSVEFACGDELSGVTDCPGAVVVEDEGSKQTVPGTVSDRAGNQATTKVTGINIDKTAPTIAASRTPKPDADGWNTTPVTASFECKDELSGIATCPEPVVVSSEGAGQSAEGTAVDHAGNTASARVQDINIDTRGPAINCAVEPASLWSPNHELVPVDVTVELTDGGSGAAGFVLTSVTSSEPEDGTGDGATTDDIVGFDLGTPDTHGSLRAERSGNGPGRTYTLTYRGTDSAGNTSSCEAEVHVAHDQG